jgi:hypothetical protein
MTAYLRIKPKRPDNPLPVRLTLSQQRILAEVIEAARQSPGALRVLAKLDWIYTAQLRAGTVRWRIEDTFRNLIATGECA